MPSNNGFRTLGTTPKVILLFAARDCGGFVSLALTLLIERSAEGAFEPPEMLQILQSGRVWDWTNKGSFQGLGGRAGAVKVSEMIANEFADQSGVSVKELYRKIMGG